MMELPTRRIGSAEVVATQAEIDTEELAAT
jgi:hypothetical protein